MDYDRVKIDPRDWEEARAWAEANAQRLGLFYPGRQAETIALYNSEEVWVTGQGPPLKSAYFYFESGRLDEPERAYLHSIRFSARGGQVLTQWSARSLSAPPETLDALIEEDPLDTSEWFRGMLKEQAQANPAMSEAYGEIYRRLFPPYEHHELHSDIGEYEEALLQDEKLIGELTEATDVYARVREKDWPRIREEMARDFPKNVILYPTSEGSLTIVSNDVLSRLYVSSPLTKRGEDLLFFLTFYRNRTRKALLYSFENNNALATGIGENGWPETLADLIGADKREFTAADMAKLKKRAIAHLKRYTPELETVYQALLHKIRAPYEHHELHTDIEDYEESLEEKGQGTKMKKEFWRAELLGRLIAIKDPKLEANAVENREGAMLEWRVEDHVNYWFWFSLIVGEDPKVCIYCDPTLSGSTQGWLSTRKIQSEAALKKLPESIEEWALEDLKNTSIPNWKGVIRGFLKNGIPEDLARAWAKVRAALVPPYEHHELHHDVGEYEEAINADKVFISLLNEMLPNIRAEIWSKDRSLKNRIYLKSFDATDAGPYDGGCVLMAQAIQKILGGNIVVLVSEDGVAQHAAVKVGNLYYDFSGSAQKDDFIAHFSKLEAGALAGRVITSIRPLQDSDLPDAPRNEEVAGEIADLIVKRKSRLKLEGNSLERA